MVHDFQREKKNEKRTFIEYRARLVYNSVHTCKCVFNIWKSHFLKQFVACLFHPLVRIIRHRLEVPCVKKRM